MDASEDMGRGGHRGDVLDVCLLPKTSLQAELLCSLNHTGVVVFAIAQAQRAFRTRRGPDRTAHTPKEQLHY